MKQIAEGSSAAESLVRDVAASTREQSETIRPLAEQVDSIIAHQVEQTGAEMSVAARAAQGLEQTASELDALTARFRL